MLVEERIDRAVERFFLCGDPREEVAVFACKSCSSQKVVPFSCKTRLFCPTCHQNWNALQGMGVLISFTEIEDYTENQARGDCEEGLSSNEDLKITDEQAADFVDSLKGKDTCDEVVDAIVAGVQSF